MGWTDKMEDRDHAPLTAVTSDRDEAIRWARELIAQGLKVVRLRSSSGLKAKAGDSVDPARSTEE